MGSIRFSSVGATHGKMGARKDGDGGEDRRNLTDQGEIRRGAAGHGLEMDRSRKVERDGGERTARVRSLSQQGLPFLFSLKK